MRKRIVMGGPLALATLQGLATQVPSSPAAEPQPEPVQPLKPIQVPEDARLSYRRLQPRAEIYVVSAEIDGEKVGLGYVGQLTRSLAWFAWLHEPFTVAESVGKSKTRKGAARMLARAVSGE